MHSGRGFTLIELIAVIVILGVLAATAVPRFVDLTGAARQASLEGVRGAIGSAAALVKGRAIVDGLTSSPSASLTEGGVTIDIEYGAPAPTATGIGVAVSANWAADLSGDFVYFNRNDELLVSPSDLYTSVPTPGEIVASGCYLIYYQELPAQPFRVFIASDTGC